jgi:hypothetical protein
MVAYHKQAARVIHTQNGLIIFFPYIQANENAKMALNRIKFNEAPRPFAPSVKPG